MYLKKYQYVRLSEPQDYSSRSSYFPSTKYGGNFCVVLCKYLGSRQTNICFWPGSLKVISLHVKFFGLEVLSPDSLGRCSFSSLLYVRSSGQGCRVCVGRVGEGAGRSSRLLMERYLQTDRLLCPVRAWVWPQGPFSAFFSRPMWLVHHLSEAQCGFWLCLSEADPRNYPPLNATMDVQVLCHKVCISFIKSLFSGQSVASLSIAGFHFLSIFIEAFQKVKYCYVHKFPKCKLLHRKHT